jgi:deoxyribonuclease-1
MKHIVIILSFLLLSSQAFPQNNQITSFSKSKKLLLNLYKDNSVTLYCGCSFKGKRPNLTSCSYIPKKNKKRADRIEWEHVVPAHEFG